MGSDDGECMPTIRTILLPKDANWHGTIFGGVILSYIDLAGGKEAAKNAPDKKFVTVAMDQVRFWAPVYVGDTVSFYANTIKIGNTSVTVRVYVEAEQINPPYGFVKVTEATLTFVAMKNGQKVPVKG